MASLLHYQGHDDVFFQEIEGVGPDGLKVAVVLMKHATNGTLYIAYPVLKASIKAQGHHLAHSGMWQVPSFQDGALHLKKSRDDETGQPAKDNAIMESILKVASKYYKKATSRHMNMVPLLSFIEHLSTTHKQNQGWKAHLIKQALSSNPTFAAWMERVPPSNSSLYLSLPPSPPHSDTEVSLDWLGWIGSRLILVSHFAGGGRGQFGRGR